MDLRLKDTNVKKKKKKKKSNSYFWYIWAVESDIIRVWRGGNKSSEQSIRNQLFLSICAQNHCFGSNTSADSDSPREIRLVPNHNTLSHNAHRLSARGIIFNNLAMHYKGNWRQQIDTLLQEKRIKPRHIPTSAQHIFTMLLYSAEAFINCQTTCHQNPHRNTWNGTTTMSTNNYQHSLIYRSSL